MLERLCPDCQDKLYNSGVQKLRELVSSSKKEIVTLVGTSKKGKRFKIKIVHNVDDTYNLYINFPILKIQKKSHASLDSLADEVFWAIIELSADREYTCSHSEPFELAHKEYSADNLPHDMDSYYTVDGDRVSGGASEGDPINIFPEIFIDD